MNCFETAPEFIDEDNRRFRLRTPVSKEQMVAKHSVLLPESLVKGKTILDLGCCMGATGHWCLSHGAAHYTGVEFQPEYAEAAQRLHNKYHSGKATIHRAAIEQWLAQPNLPTFDIVCILGVIYAFVDYFSILKLSTAIARSHIIIEGLYAGIAKEHPNFCGVQFMDDQPINLATEHSSLLGRGARVMPKGMEWLMLEFGFKSKEGLLYPPLVSDTPDVYNRPLHQLGKRHPVRYLMRFERTDVQAKSVSENLQAGVGTKELWSNG